CILDTCKTCPDGWVRFKDSCYQYHHTAKDWADAERTCIRLHGNLASIHSKEEHDFIQHLIHRATGKDGQTHIGGHDTAKEGAWMWSDGTPFDFKGLWGPGQPDNAHHREHCLELNYRRAPNDNQCKIAKPFVCGMHL
ncbi:galactose-specific lectin nattectin-like, partial [Plectropomus leopardus]|uniref:galactose-specific lectin nattectin-like n=1 Tax=Plectropomus leopardus TaxID=160734 RepID=UPI001C4D86B7